MRLVTVVTIVTVVTVVTEVLLVGPDSHGYWLLTPHLSPAPAPHCSPQAEDTSIINEPHSTFLSRG
jgi:hypothetical protein